MYIFNDEADNLHVHVDSTQRDCDGQYDRSHINEYKGSMLQEAGIKGCYWINEEIGSIVSIWEGGGKLEVISANQVSWYTPTEEGYEHIELTFCSDDCNTDNSTYRDHTAESMGY